MLQQVDLSSRLTFDLQLEKPFPVPSELLARWGMEPARQSDAAGSGLIFLAELLNLLAPDPAPRLKLDCWSEVDMFGGQERAVEIRSGRAHLIRRMKAEIRESWSSLDVEEDLLEIQGLDPWVFLEWNGNISPLGLDLEVGNLPASLEPALRALAGKLYSKVTVSSAPPSLAAWLRAALRRRAEHGDSSLDHWPVGDLERGLLVEALRDREEFLARAALQVLAKTGQLEHPDVLSRLTWVMKDGPGVLAASVPELLPVPLSPSGETLLRLGLSRGDDYVQKQALSSLWRFGESARVLVPYLCNLLGKKGFYVQEQLVYKLGELEDQRAVPSLVSLLKSKDEGMRSAAASALQSYQDASLVEPLLKALRDPEKDVRREAATALGGQADARVLPALLEALTESLKGGDPWVIYGVLEGLKRQAHPESLLALAQVYLYPFEYQWVQAGETVLVILEKHPGSKVVLSEKLVGGLLNGVKAGAVPAARGAVWLLQASGWAGETRVREVLRARLARGEAELKEVLEKVVGPPR